MDSHLPQSRDLLQRFRGSETLATYYPAPFPHPLRLRISKIARNPFKRITTCYFPLLTNDLYDINDFISAFLIFYLLRHPQRRGTGFTGPAARTAQRQLLCSRFNRRGHFLLVFASSSRAARTDLGVPVWQSRAQSRDHHHQRQRPRTQSGKSPQTQTSLFLEPRALTLPLSK